ncbi:MAG: phenylalanine--tRNA ligase beta subunit-related protein [Anaerolineales bacterium]
MNFIGGKRMLLISGTQEWKVEHPGAAIGLLELSNVENDEKSPKLDQRKRALEAELVKRYGELSRQELVALPVMAAYRSYYKQFKKTYHVQLQIESIAKKGKKLPNVSPLVDANFMAEVETFVLTAGHDVAKLRGEIAIDVAHEGDHITQMNGSDKSIYAGDMIMRDKEGICCSILYGQDNRSPIMPETEHVLYVAYAPGGVPREAVEKQLLKIEENVRLFSTEAIVEQRRLLIAV